MKEKTKQKFHDAASSIYRKSMNDAIRQMTVGASYAEDGACLDAIRCASEAITLLVQAYSVKDRALRGTN